MKPVHERYITRVRVADRDLIRVELFKGCILLLTEEEVSRGLKRGKWLRRRQVFDARMKKEEG